MFSPSFLKDNLTEYRALGLGLFFFFLVLIISLYFFLACMISEKLEVILIFVLLEVRCFFPLASFRNFSLFFNFLQFEMICLSIVSVIENFFFFFLHLSWLLLSDLSRSMACFLTLIWGKISDFIVSLFLLFLSLFSFFFRYSHYPYVIPFVVVPQLLFYPVVFGPADLN